jgi:hypothetical protein
VYEEKMAGKDRDMPKGGSRGNGNAVTHAGHAQIAPVVLAEVADAIREALPVRHEADEWAVAELADALIRLHRFRAFVDANDPWAQRSKVELAKVRSAQNWESR